MPDQTPKILLIEEDQPTRELYQRELGRNYRVFACSSESEALDLLHQYSFDVIVLEPALAQGQGWAFLIRLRAMLQTRTTLIIVCSILDERRRGLELGANLCLIKPVLPTLLHDTIHQMLQNLSGYY